jgi:repressor LexA
MLTDRQRQVLEHIRSTVEQRGYPPSVREIGDAVGLSSPSSVHAQLNSLVEAGMIRKDPSKPRAIVVVDETPAPAIQDRRMRDIPLLGRIAAGTPILAAEQVDEVMPLPTELVGDGPVFLLEVKGDSMVDAGIHEGDLVAVHKQSDARDGEIVACLIGDEEATVKRLQRKDGQVYLHSENPAYEPMVFSDGVELIGKVVSVLRRYP